jgi:hypothetical protein
MPDNVKVLPAASTGKTTTPEKVSGSSASVVGSGKPVHTPVIAFQIYRDQEEGKDYMWIGDHWTPKVTV